MEGWKLHICINDDIDKGGVAPILDTCVMMTLYMGAMDPVSFGFDNSFCHDIAFLFLLLTLIHNEYYVTSIYPFLSNR